MGAVSALETVAATDLTTPGPRHSLADRQRQLETTSPPIARPIRAATAGLSRQPTSAWSARKIALLIRGLEAELPTPRPD